MVPTIVFYIWSGELRRGPLRVGWRRTIYAARDTWDAQGSRLRIVDHVRTLWRLRACSVDSGTSRALADIEAGWRGAAATAAAQLDEIGGGRVVLYCHAPWCAPTEEES